MVLPSWTTAHVKLSVPVNGVLLPFKKAPDLMQRYVRPALFSTGHQQFELQFAGTALMASYRRWHFAIATVHQTKGKDYTNENGAFVVVVDDGGRRLAIPPTSAHVPKFEHADHQSLEDLIFFDYNRVKSAARPQHLDLSDVLWSDAGEPVDYSFVIGYPSSSVQIELDDDGEHLKDFTLRWIRQDLEATEPQPMDTENRSIFVKHSRSTRLSIEPDGLSGSPVFSIARRPNSSDRLLKFDGIVTDAKGDRFAVYPSVHIRDALDQIATEASLS